MHRRLGQRRRLFEEVERVARDDEQPPREADRAARGREPPAPVDEERARRGGLAELVSVERDAHRLGERIVARADTLICGWGGGRVAANVAHTA